MKIPIFNSNAPKLSLSTNKKVKFVMDLEDNSIFIVPHDEKVSDGYVGVTRDEALQQVTAGAYVVFFPSVVTSVSIKG